MSHSTVPLACTLLDHSLWTEDAALSHVVGMLDNQPMGPFTSLPVLDDLAHRFFRQFSRTEYALKAVGHLKSPNGAAVADWKAFGDCINTSFLSLRQQRDDLRDACDYMIGHPPRKQIALNGELQWSDNKPDAETETSLLLQYVCRVRNNLFHGGKFSGRWIDPERSELLLRHALTILGHSVTRSPKVLAAYNH